MGDTMMAVTVIVVVIIVIMMSGVRWNLSHSLNLLLFIIVVVIVDFQVVGFHRDRVRKVNGTIIRFRENTLSALANHVGAIWNASAIKAACSIATTETTNIESHTPKGSTPTVKAALSITAANVADIVCVRTKGNALAVNTRGAVTVANVTDIVCG
jgi:hypothetical protein